MPSSEQQQTVAIITTFPRKFFLEMSPRQFVRAFFAMNDDDSIYWQCKFGAPPTRDVVYCYIVAENRIRYRANIAGFEPGGLRVFGDGRSATARSWMILTAPVIKAPYRIERRGFQGFRYSGIIF